MDRRSDRAALHLAVYSCHGVADEMKLIRLAEDESFDVATRDIHGKTILHHVVRRGHVQLAEKLLERGADVNAADEAGVTPLLSALISYSGNAAELLPVLIKYGADVFAKDHLGENVLHWLPVRPLKQVAELARTFIEMGVSVHDRSAFGYQPIHWAAFWGEVDLVKLYLDHGAEVNAQTNLVAFDFHNFHKERLIINALQARGADLYSQMIGGRTMLHAACWSLKEDCIKLLLSAGANVLIEDRFGNTPFNFTKPDLHPEHPSVRLMLRTIALKKVCLQQPSIELKDERLINQHPQLLDYYRDCHAHISRMTCTRFMESCSFLDLLVKNCRQVAALMRNPNFEANFELYDLSGFSMYAEDVRRAFERARKYCRSMLKQEDVINEASNYVLPDVVMRKVVNYIFS